MENIFIFGILLFLLVVTLSNKAMKATLGALFMFMGLKGLIAVFTSGIGFTLYFLLSDFPNGMGENQVKELFWICVFCFFFGYIIIGGIMFPPVRINMEKISGKYVYHIYDSGIAVERDGVVIGNRTWSKEDILKNIKFSDDSENTIVWKEALKLHKEAFK